MNDDNSNNRLIRRILNDLRMIENENEYKTENSIKELKRQNCLCWMKSTTECRYWSEFYHYEQWLIDNDLLNSSSCYSMTHQMGDEYLIGLSRYVLSLKKRFKKNTVRVKVSRLIQCFRSAVSECILDLIRESVMYQ